jgi:hypothetical protein
MKSGDIVCHPARPESGVGPYILNQAQECKSFSTQSVHEGHQLPNIAYQSRSFFHSLSVAAPTSENLACTQKSGCIMESRGSFWSDASSSSGKGLSSSVGKAWDAPYYQDAAPGQESGVSVPVSGEMIGAVWESSGLRALGRWRIPTVHHRVPPGRAI